MDEFKEYLDGFIVKDLTTKEQSRLGVSILYAIAKNDVEFHDHKHNIHNQLIRIIKGSIEVNFNKTDVLALKDSDCFFCEKGRTHNIKYLKNTRLIIVYIPAL